MPEAQFALLVGGGRLANDVRRRDRQAKLSPETCHDLALRAMSVNAGAVSLLSPKFCYCQSSDEVRTIARRSDCIPIINPERILDEVESASGRLPRTWDVTSDSIAAHMAQYFNAGLLLLKSTDLPRAWIRRSQAGQPAERQEILGFLADARLVDAEFSRFAGRLSALSWRNLRRTDVPATKIW